MAHTHFALKKIAAVAVVAAAIVGFSACGSSNGSAASSELDQIKKNGAIVFGTEGTYAPFSYHDSDNKLTGYDVEVATAVAKELGVKAKFVESNWDSLLAGVDSKKFDSVADQVTPNGERKQKYDFSDLYTYSPRSCGNEERQYRHQDFCRHQGKERRRDQDQQLEPDRPRARRQHRVR